MTSTMTTTAVHSPATDYTVLDRPYTYAEYNALPDIGPYGEITRTISLPLDELMESNYDSVSERLCAAVVDELGDEWQLHSYSALGPNTNPASPGNETLFQVTMSPGLDEDGDDTCLCDAILPCPVHKD